MRMAGKDHLRSTPKDARRGAAGLSDNRYQMHRPVGSSAIVNDSLMRHAAAPTARPAGLSDELRCSPPTQPCNEKVEEQKWRREQEEGR